MSSPTHSSPAATVSSSPGLSRRSLLGAAAAVGATVLGGGALVGCSSSSGASSSGVTLAYWDWYVSQASWVNNEIKLFQQAHPGIKIQKTTQVTTQYANLVSLAFRSGNPPDALMVPQSPPIQQQVSQGWFLPLNKWGTSAWQSRFPQGSFVEGADVFDGKLYTAPFAGPAPSFELYIHNGVFKSAGLTNPDGSVKLPKTWDDVSRAAAAITAKSGGNTYAFGFGGSDGLLLIWLDMFVRGAGSPGGAAPQGTDSMDYRVGKWTFGTDRNYADFIALLLEWKKKGYFYPDSMSISDEQARAFFERGRFGMTVGGVWNQPEWSQHNFTDYSLVTLPSLTGTPKAFFYGPPGSPFVAVSAQTKHADEAWAWFDWLYSPAAGKRWVEQNQGLSVFPQSNDPKAITFKPFAQYAAMANDAMIGPDPTIRNPQLGKVVLETVTPDITSVLAGVYTGQIGDVPGALSSLGDRYNQALATAVQQAAAGGAKVSLSDYAFPDWDITKPYANRPAS
jgi:ABC-type glycerol-3-phosphate transport system substrate-binding protein